MSKRLYDYDEAAAELRVSKTWLQRHIRRLPHVKFVQAVYFTDADLDRITEMHHHEPDQSAAPGVGARPLGELKPLPARGKSA